MKKDFQQLSKTTRVRSNTHRTRVIEKKKNKNTKQQIQYTKIQIQYEFVWMQTTDYILVSILRHVYSRERLEIKTK